MKRLALIVLLLAACRQPVHRAPVLFLGLDGADWQLLDPYLRNGTMPNLAALAKEGRTGVLTTIQPPLSPLVWTTMMTGASPLEHGILDFTRRNPETGSEEPITREERRVPAVWNLADLEGRSSAVFGMWATWPAEPVRGLMVADRFFSFTSRDRRPPPGIVHPPDREAWARQILDRVEGETGYEDLKEYLPWLDRAAYEEAVARPDPYAHPVSALRRILVETRAYDALARSWLEKETPDLTVLYFQGTDTLGHVFAPYAPPRQPGISEEDFERYHRVPELYFAEVDRRLGAWKKWADEHGAVLMIASDHGFLWGDGRPRNLESAKAATAGLWHRDEGIYLLRGPGVDPEEGPGERGRGRVDQVCATLLALLGLPPGQDVAGPPLPGSPVPDGKPVDYRALWKPAPIPDLPSGGEEEVAKLRSLGYLGSDSGKGSGPRTPASYNNEGLLLRQAGRTDEAARAFEKAIALAPNQASALWNLSELLESSDQDRSDDLLIQALESGLPGGTERVLGRVRQADPDRRLRLLDRALAVGSNEPKLWLARGQTRFERKECRQALSDFERAASLAPAERLAFNGAGLASLCLEDPAGAARAFRRSLEIDPVQPEIREVLAQLGGP
jgi:Tfp pilus assembly protein PilF